MIPPPEWFLERVDFAAGLKAKIGVVLVANVKGRTRPPQDYEVYSIVTEFLSTDELDYLIAGFESGGFYCEVIIDEERFLRWLDRERLKFPRESILVYNIAQNGIGPARSALVPGLCRLSGIPILDSDAYVVAVSRHKFHLNAILGHFGLPVARSWLLTSKGWWPEAPPQGIRLIAKPTYESASIGIGPDSVFEMYSGVERGLQKRVVEFHQPLTIQEFIRGFEIEVPVFEADEPRTIAAVGLELHGKRKLDNSFLTYDDVASDRYSFYDFNEEAPETATVAMRIASEVFRCLGFAGVGRVDFRVQEDGKPIIIEIAAKPHLTKHSSFMYAMNCIGRSHVDLLMFLIGRAAERYSIQS